MMDVSLSRIITGVLVIFAVIVLVPLIALATYNHPSPTDDYCFTDTVLQYGFWQAQRYYYDGWTGRYFHNFIVHTNPLVVGWYGGYKVYPVVFLTVLVGGCYALASQWLYRAVKPYIKVGVAMGFFIGFVTTLPVIPEYFYWYTGLASYGLSSALFIILLAVFLAHQRRGFGLLWGYILAESLLIAAIIGSSEMTMVLMLSVLGLMALGELIQRRRLSVTTVLLLGVSVVSCYYLLTAPGNAIRLGGNPNGGDPVLTTVSSLRYAANYVPRQILLTPWLPLSMLYLPVAWQLLGTGRRADLPAYLRLHPVWGILHGVATVLVLISLHFYGVGIPPIPRLINLVNLAFWLSWLYNLTLLVVAFRYRVQPDRWQPYLRPTLLIALVWAIVAAVRGPVLPVVYGDWLSGRASQYDRAMLDRYAQLTQSADSEILLAPLPNYPVSLFLEDIHTDPKHLWNRCWADYFHKKTIILKRKPEQSGQ